MVQDPLEIPFPPHRHEHSTARIYPYPLIASSGDRFSRAMSREGGCPNSRRYSRLNCDGLS